MMHPDISCCRGPLVSVEGISGAGKTYLTRMLAATQVKHEAAPVIIEGFSGRQRSGRRNLGRDLLRVLVSASGDDKFLRSGYPAADTLLLLAIKMYDYETSIPHLASGQVVIEGRSLYTTAVYQSIILCPGDAEALAQAREILEMASEWRPLPDLTILVTDDPAAAIDRAERRDDRTVSDEERRIHFRAAVLYEHLAAEDPARIQVLDRRIQDNPAALNSMQDWISRACDRIGCLPEPWAMCRYCTGPCRLRGTSATAATPDTSPGG